MNGFVIRLSHFRGARRHADRQAARWTVVREAEMLPAITRHFAARGFRAIAEVPVDGRRADLVAISDDAMVAVELKISRWRDTLCLLKLFCRKENSFAPPRAARTP